MSSATEVPPDRFAVKKLLAGSIVAVIDVTAGFSGAGPTAQAIVADLQLQAANPASTLMHGLVTKFTQNIVILPAAVRIPTRQKNPCSPNSPASAQSPANLCAKYVWMQI
jgi:hypothetical protein